MADLARMPGFIATRRVMDVVDRLGATSGSVDATNPERVVVQFPSTGFGDIGTLATTAGDAFRAAGYQPLTMDVNDRTARFTMRLAA